MQRSRKRICVRRFTPGHGPHGHILEAGQAILVEERFIECKLEHPHC
jgi:hypothetical protein